ncbi:MAG TPA: 50S ribosomal protein L11 methyltransferase [Steroidobacteraceae bacterium]|nr:50S ribosomal protein L11 methyltransferase [Steroidobacteraceae bacterium]
MPFLQLTFELGGGEAEAAQQACFDLGALSVTCSDARDDAVLEPAPGEVRLWPATRLCALFEPQADPAGLAASLGAALGLDAAQVRPALIADRQWEREWLRDFHAMRFGERLWVCPQHELHPGAHTVVLDPGLAFGTGTHATTALCLAWLDRNLAPGARVIDYGCGSGILGIAALKLGAGRVWFHDLDPQALLATADNARRNAVEAQVCAQAPELPAGVDLLLANILSGPLCALAPRFARLVHPGGEVVLSGLMNREAVEVTRAYEAWFHIRHAGEREGWVVLQGKRHDAGAPD